MEVLNLTPEYGLTVTYEFKNDVHQTFMGRDYINARWLYPVAKFNFQVAFFNQSVYEYVKDFFLFVEGGEDEFLFEDPCNNSCYFPYNNNFGIAVKGVFVDNGDGSFQLYKEWAIGGNYYRKPVTHPKEVSVFDSGGNPVNATINYNGGSATGVNATMFWTGTFYTVVRFENDSIPKEILASDEETGDEWYQIPDLRLIEVKQYPTQYPSNLASAYTHPFGLSVPINSQVNLLGKTDIFTSDSGYEARDALDTYKRDINFSYSSVNYREKEYLQGLWFITLGGWASFQFTDIDLDFGYNVRFNDTPSFSSIVQPISTSAVAFGLDDILFKVDNINFSEEFPNPIKSTFCQTWKIEREDGFSQGFTNHDRNFSFDGLAYPAVFGFSGTASSQTSELSTDSTELTGVFGDSNYTEPQFFSLFIMEEDLLAGKYDNASVTVQVFDWMANTVFSTQFKGTIGGYSVGFLADKAKQYQIEVQSQSEKLDVSVSAKTSSECRHRFLSQGYGRCNLASDPNNTSNANAPQIKATVGGANNTTDIIISSGATNNWEGFRYGTVRFLTGKLAGMEIYIIGTFSPSGIVLLYPLPFTPTVGDEVLLTRPCNKTVEACNNYGNIANYGGFPRLPGIDNLVSGAEE